MKFSNLAKPGAAEVYGRATDVTRFLGVAAAVVAVQLLASTAATTKEKVEGVRCIPPRYCYVDFKIGECVPNKEGRKRDVTCETIRDEEKASRKK